MDVVNFTNSTIFNTTNLTHSPNTNILISGLTITLIYASVHLLLVIILAVVIQYKAAKDGSKLSIRKLMKRVWHLRGILTPLIVHIYDTATGK